MDIFLFDNENKIMTEFVGLRVKCNSYLLEVGIEINKDKGIPKTVVRLQMQHQHWKSCLFNKKIVRMKMNFFDVQDHQVRSVSKSKIELNVFDYKGYILDNGVTTLPYGHFKIQ